MLFRVFLDEIQNGLLFFRKHVRRYTEHSYGSQALDHFVPLHSHEHSARLRSDHGTDDADAPDDIGKRPVEFGDSGHRDQRQLPNFDATFISLGTWD